MPGAVLNSIPPAAPPLGGQNAAVHINVAEIPDHVRDDLAAATLDFVRGILRQPGGRAAMDAKIKARKQMSDHAKERSYV